jgi:hypothetical protein
MLEQSSKNITSTLLMSLLTGALLFAGMLLFNASRLSTAVGVAKGELGPVQLFELSRQVLPGGGYTANVHFVGQGLVVYFLVWLLLGAAVVVYRSKRV